MLSILFLIAATVTLLSPGTGPLQSTGLRSIGSRPWDPDWAAMLATAPEIDLDGHEGAVYIIADTHLGDSRATPEALLALLQRLENPGTVVFLGDLFKVWLALPRFSNATVRTVLNGFERLRAAGTCLIFVVGNRDYFLPGDPARVAAQGLPFDHVVPGMAFLRWRGRRYGLTHGDIVNRQDRQHLLWRWVSRSWPMGVLFRTMPPTLARWVAARLERALSGTNRDVKDSYPQAEVQAFADAVTPGCSLFLIGHFHRDATVQGAEGGVLRLVPDWFSARQFLCLDPAGDPVLLSLE